MYLYYIYREGSVGYDEFEGAIVAAESEEDAKGIHPNGGDNNETSDMGSWLRKDHVQVELIGTAISGTIKGVILSSFRAG